MTTLEAIKILKEMDAQIIHGTSVFKDIADLILAMENENVRRIRHLNRLATWAQQDPTGPLHKDDIQAWALNEIRSALGEQSKPIAWQPRCVKEQP